MSRRDQRRVALRRQRAERVRDGAAATRRCLARSASVPSADAWPSTARWLRRVARASRGRHSRGMVSSPIWPARSASVPEAPAHAGRRGGVCGACLLVRRRARCLARSRARAAAIGASGCAIASVSRRVRWRSRGRRGSPSPPTCPRTGRVAPQVFAPRAWHVGEGGRTAAWTRQAAGAVGTTHGNDEPPPGGRLDAIHGGSISMGRSGAGWCCWRGLNSAPPAPNRSVFSTLRRVKRLGLYRHFGPVTRDRLPRRSHPGAGRGAPFGSLGPVLVAVPPCSGRRWQPPYPLGTPGWASTTTPFSRLFEPTSKHPPPPRPRREPMPAPFRPMLPRRLASCGPARAAACARGRGVAVGLLPLAGRGSRVRAGPGPRGDGRGGRGLNGSAPPADTGFRPHP